MAGIESEAHRCPIDAHELRRLPFIPDVLIAGLFQDLVERALAFSRFDEAADSVLDVGPRLLLGLTAA